MVYSLAFSDQYGPIGYATRCHRSIWIFHISAGEFCDAAQEALLSLQRQAVIVFSQAMGNTTIARIETATAQIIYGV